MRPAEARWIARQLEQLPLDARSPLVNVGSSTSEFREVRQPHIDREVFAPLRAAGVQILHADLKPQAGVDIAGDLTDPGVQERIRALQPRVLLCSNLLEHVEDPATLARALRSLLVRGAVAIVTVPRSYPYHADPIDTGFRPTPDELAALFPGCSLRHAEVVEDVTLAQEWLHQGAVGALTALRTLTGALRPIGEPARAHRSRLRWLFKKFSTTCIVVQVPP